MPRYFVQFSQSPQLDAGFQDGELDAARLYVDILRSRGIAKTAYIVDTWYNRVVR